jgi:hypothetical protein
MAPDASWILTGGFAGLPWLMLMGAVFALRRWGAPGDARRFAIIGVVALSLAAGLSLSGITARLDTVPPPALPIFGVWLIGTVVLGRSRFGRRLSALPLNLLIGYQAFRILVELLLHQGVTEGVVPPQLSWSGRNLDIIPGLLAVPFGLWAHRLPRAALWGFNLVGLGLLLNVIVVAILSVPTPFQVFTPDNTWVGYFPFTWLPTGLVALALLGHVVLTRRLLRGAA